MKRAFITGITGQDGSYLAELLLEKGYEVHGMIRRSSSFNTERIDHLYQDPHIMGVRLFLHYGDLSDSVRLTRLLYELKPGEVYHLGAQSHVRVSFDMPEYTGDVTGLGTVRILDALREAVSQAGDGLVVMVTGGSTPAEGLPGETSCGDLDPSVVLKLAGDGDWGPEGTSRLLTCESGLRGLVGRDVSLAEALESPDGESQLARDVFLHSLLRACGAGIAALGGLDAIVYSGRYASSAAVLHDWLNQRLKQTIRRDTACLVHSRTLHQHLRDIAYVLVREDRAGAAAT